MGEALGNAGVSLEGGGVFVCPWNPVFGLAHFLFEDGEAAVRALQSAGIEVLAVREVVMPRLKQDIPGQLGALTRRMAEAGVNIEVQYSDHVGNLVLVVDDFKKAQGVADEWIKER